MIFFFSLIFMHEIYFEKNSAHYFLNLRKGFFNFSKFPSPLSLIRISNRYILKSDKYFLCKIDNAYLPCSNFSRAAKLRLFEEEDGNFFILNEEKNCLAPEYAIDPVRQTYQAYFIDCNKNYVPNLIIKKFT